MRLVSAISRMPESPTLSPGCTTTLRMRPSWGACTVAKASSCLARSREAIALRSSLSDVATSTGRTSLICSSFCFSLAISELSEASVPARVSIAWARSASVVWARVR